MVKVTLSIEGMACSMCEAHINEAIRKAFAVKRVTSSHSKGRTEIIAETVPEEQKLREVIGATGYHLLDIHCEPYLKKGLFSFGK